MCTHYFGGTKLQLIIKPTMLNALPIFSLFCPSLSCRSQCLENESCSVMSDSLQSHGPYSPQNSPGQNTAVGSLFLLQGIFPTQGSNPGLPHCRQTLYCLSHQGSRGIGDGQGGLACCSPRSHKESDTTEWLNWTDWSLHGRKRTS